jgi:membrane-bound lytic murein transglycosylase F
MRLLVVLLVLLGQSAWAVDDSLKVKRGEDTYDKHFRKYTKRYFGPAFNWQWFKAQAIAESNLNPDIKSQAGAIGLMQILPRTYAEIREKNPHFKDIRDPEWNIAAGIFYDRELYRKWREPLPDQERLLLAFASYNAGYVRIRRAYKRAEAKEGNPESWQNIKPYVPGETRHYVGKIQSLLDTGENGKYRRLRGIEKYLAASTNEDDV